MTPPNVLGTPKPESSVMTSKILGAFFGGTIRGAHHAFDWSAPSLMTPPNAGSGAGSCFPSMAVVAAGEPGGAAAVAAAFPSSGAADSGVGPPVAARYPAIAPAATTRAAAIRVRVAFNMTQTPAVWGNSLVSGVRATGDPTRARTA